MVIATCGSGGAVLVDGATPGWYNDSLGTILDGTAPQFPQPYFSGGGDPDIYPAAEPSLAAAEGVLGDWLSPTPVLNGNWSYEFAIPSTWALNTETAIIYRVFVPEPGLSNVVGDFDVDNGLFVWVNGQYKFGAVQPGLPSAAGQFEYTNVDLGVFAPGTNFIQVLREDNGISTGYQIRISTATNAPPAPANLLFNGDFEAGNVGFETEYAYSPVGAGDPGPGNYSVVTNPAVFNGFFVTYGDHTSGSGLMLAVDSSTSGSLTFWRETVAVAPGEQYRFSGYAANPYNGTAPVMDIYINGVKQGEGIVVGDGIGQWQYFERSWNSGSATQAVLEIRNASTAYLGNDLTLDDLVFEGNQSVIAPPVITDFAPKSGTNGAVVTLTGQNFSPSATSNVVYFGAVRATVTQASSTSLTVLVPAGATYAPITETVNGLVASTTTPFQPTFAGNGSDLSVSSFASRVDLAAGDGAHRSTIADLDGDGKPDIAVANVYGHTVCLFRNESSPGAIAANSFGPRIDLPAPGAADTSDNPYGFSSADVDGDGKLDLVACDRLGNNVAIYRNISSPGSLSAGSFEPYVSFPVGADPRYARVADLDGDGRPDIVSCNYAANTISILRNTGSAGSLDGASFAARVDLPAGAGPYDVAVGDLDGDGKPDLAVVNTSGPTTSIYRNISSPGLLNSNSFAARVDLPALNGNDTILLGDIDGDGKPDLVIGSYLSYTMSVYRNQADPGVLDTNSFAARVDFGSGNWTHNVALADLNGDGKTDIATVGELPSHASVFQNLSTPGSFTTASLAARFDLGAGWNGWGITAGDLDGDGRPDLVFCNAYDDTVSIYRNVSGLITEPETPPVITQQPLDQQVPEGGAVDLSVMADGSEPFLYQWFFNGSPLNGATNRSLGLSNILISQAGYYSVMVSNSVGNELSRQALVSVLPLTPTVLVDESSPGYYNEALGTLLDGTAPQFPLPYPTGGDPTFYPAEVPDLSAAAGVLGDWLSPVPVLNENWNYVASIPSTWTVNAETALIYLVDGGSEGIVDVRGDFDADNGLFVWVNGQYKFGVIQPGLLSSTGQFEYTKIPLGDLLPGTNYIQILREDNGIANGYKARIASWKTSGLEPEILQHPVAATKPAGSAVNFTVEATGAAPLQYQWLFNGEILTGGTNSNLVLTNLQTAQAGDYSVVVSNAFGSVTSSNALLTIQELPAMVTRQPVSQTVYAGQSAAFSVGVSGSTPVRLQWQKDGEPVPGGTSSTLRLFNVQMDDAGEYRAAVSNDFGSDLSQPATLTVLPVPDCFTPPEGLVAWWPGESNTWDVVEGFDGQFYPGQGYPSPIGYYYSSGLVGTAFLFQTFNALLVPSAPELDVGAGDGFTVETWINPTLLTSSAFFGWGGSGPGIPSSPTGVNLRMNSLGYLEAQLIQTNGLMTLLRSAAPILQTGLWQHVALEYDRASGEASLFLNAVSVATTNLGSATLRTSGWVRIGNASGSLFYGLIDEPSLYNRALAPAEIEGIYHAAVTGKCPPPPPPCLNLPGIVGYWQGESNVLDSVGGNDGYIVPTNYPPASAYVAGVKGAAFDFNNINFISVPASDLLDVGQGEGLTVEGWIYPQSVQTPIVEWTDTNEFGVFLAMGYTSSYGLEGSVTDTEGHLHPIRSGSVFGFGGWQHFALTYDKASGVGSLYAGGTLIASTNMGTFTPKTDTGLLVGYHPRYPGSFVYGGPPISDRRMVGAIDELAIYRRALSGDEIRQLSRLRVERCDEYPPLIGHQPQDEIVLEGNDASIEVVAGGSQPLAFQWYRNGELVSGAQDARLDLAALPVAASGDYTVVVTNAYGSETSHVARLEVLPAGQCLPVPEGAVAWWKGDDNEWDEFGQNDAAWVIFSGAGGYTNGVVGDAFHLNGSGYLQAGPSATLDVGQGDGFTVEGWVRPDTYSPGALVDWNDGRGNVGVGLMLGRTGPGTIDVTLSDTNAVYSFDRVVNFSTALYTLGAPGSPLPGWVHIAFTFEKASGTATVLLNGQVVLTRTLNPIRTFASPQVPVPFSPTTSGGLYLGLRPSGIYSGIRFRGGMDEITVYDRTLSSTELRYIYVNGAGGKCQPPPPPCVRPPEGIAAWWRAESNTLDSVAGNHGAIYPSNYPAALAYQAGRIDSGFSFRGQNYVTVPRSDILDAGQAGGLTIEAWINPDRSSPMPIVEWTDGNVFGPTLWMSYYRTPSDLEANLVDTAGNNHVIQTITRPLTYNLWQHVAVTYDRPSGAAALYVNGTLVVATNLGSFIPRTDLPLNIGYHPANLAYNGIGSPPPSPRQFTGAMDEIAIYRRALGAEEIKELARPRPGKCLELPPAIARQPQDEVVLEGGTAVLEVQAGGSEPLHYDWLREGQPVPAANASSLQIAPASVAEGGSYAVVISNAFGVVTSRLATLLVLPAGECLPTPMGAVAFWRGESNTVDELGNHPASWTNTPAAYSSDQTGGAVVNSAFRFNGSSYLLVPGDADLDVGAGGGFTVEGWIKPDFYAGGPQPIFDWNDGRGTIGVGLMYSRTSPGSLEVTLTDTNAAAPTTQRTISFGTPSNTLGNPTNPNPAWTHVALTFEKTSGMAVLFVNGKPVVQRALGQVPSIRHSGQLVPFAPATSGNLYLGWRPSGVGSGPRFRGSMDEMTVYYRALTPVELKSIYVVGANGKCTPQPACLPVTPDLVGWWRGESNVLDSAGSNHGIPLRPLSYTNGVVDLAFQFSNGLYARVPAAPDLDVGAAPGMTFEAWINPASATDYGLASWQSSAGESGVQMGTSLSRGPNYFEVDLVDTLGQAHVMSTPYRALGASSWQHLAIIYEKGSGLAAIYVDGAPVTVTNLGSFTPRTTADFFLGRQPGGANPGSYRGYGGGMDEVMLHRRALSSGEITAHYRNPDFICKEPPVITRQPESIRVNVGDLAVLSVEAVGSPVLRYHWTYADGKPIYAGQVPATNVNQRELVFSNAARIHENVYRVVVSNAFGLAVSSNATLLVNYPPLASAADTVPTLISANGSNVLAVLDGSASLDPDLDPLTYDWFLDGAEMPIATGVVAVVTLPVGANPLRLVVSDGLLQSTNEITVEVLTTSQAADRLLALVEEQAANPQPLGATLRAALAAIGRGQPEVAINQLHAFQNKINAQVAPSDPELAAQLIAAAQAIIDALSGGSGDLAQAVVITGISHDGKGKARLQISGRAGRQLIVEASSDGLHWSKVGVAQPRGGDQFEFEDAAGSSVRFYRVVTPK